MRDNFKVLCFASFKRSVRKVLWENLKNFALSWNIRQNWNLPFMAVANIPLDMVNTSCLECIFHPKTNANLIQHQIQVLACTVSGFMLWKNLWELKEFLFTSHFYLLPSNVSNFSYSISHKVRRKVRYFTIGINTWELMKIS